MTLEEAKRIGYKQALQKTAIFVVLCLLFFMYQETRGDFANGFIFFMDAVLSVRVIGILIVLFGLTYIYGKRAGRSVILERKHFVWVALKYTVIIVLFVTIPAFAVTILSGLATQNLQEFVLAFVLGSLFWMLPMLLVWLWACYRMHVVAKQNHSAQSAGSATVQP